jgi:hypothetical protein
LFCGVKNSLVDMQCPMYHIMRNKVTQRKPMRGCFLAAMPAIISCHLRSAIQAGVVLAHSSKL